MSGTGTKPSASLPSRAVTLVANAYAAVPGDIGTMLEVTTGGTAATISLAAVIASGNGGIIGVRKAIGDTLAGDVFITDGTNRIATVGSPGFWSEYQTNGTTLTLLEQWPSESITYVTGNYLFPIDCYNFTGGTTWASVNTARMFANPFRLYAPLTITSLRCGQTVFAASAAARLSIYNGTSIPDNASLILDVGEADLSQVGNNNTWVSPGAISQVLKPGDYWGVIHLKNVAANPSVRMKSSTQPMAYIPQALADSITGGGTLNWYKDVAYAVAPANLPTTWTRDNAGRPLVIMGY